MFKKISLILIKFYQKTLSFDHGFLSYRYPNGYCKFHPTCSEYTYSAIEKYGFLKGWLMGIKRILRCNPWSKGGLDPIK
ncbi:MAG: membrane protein insertion efficiency factor YidD [Patescibacteria group bacterium]|nr:membrane protein insertion efficiency factor YidD [Patescibacteria group bacterium]